MTDYNDGQWHGWNGGECPVHPKTVVEIVTNNGLCEPRMAQGVLWDNTAHPVRAFRVVKEHREPREWWVWENSEGDLSLASERAPSAFKVREVIE